MDTIQQYFHIGWKSYQEHQLDSSQQLLSSGQFSDVTLVTDDLKTLPAHRLILSSGSKKFKQLLDLNPNPNSMLYLKGISKATLETILSFLYTGQAQVGIEDVDLFIKSSSDLGIIGLAFEELPKYVTSSQDTGVVIPQLQLEEISVQNEGEKGIFKDTILNSSNSRVNHSLLEHEEKEENVETQEIFKCTKCPYVGSQIYRLKRHFNQTHGKFKVEKRELIYPFDKVDLCDNKEVESSSTEVINIKENTKYSKTNTIYKDNFACDICADIFDNNVSYLRHMARGQHNSN